MQVQLSKHRLRRSLSFLAFAMVLGLSALGLSQCRLVTDAVTGIDAKSNAIYGSRNRSRCEKQCNEAYKRCLQDEGRRHNQAYRDCKTLPRTQQNQCKKQESQRHSGNEKRCSNDKKTCKSACGYLEGSGGGGR